MYLHNLIIENMGAIERCELVEQDLIKDDGTPRVIVLVGQNGSGKTTLLSSIIDSFHEFANDSFDNVLPKHGFGYRYFKITGLNNQKINTDYGFNYLQFKNNLQILEYIDKSGKLNFSESKLKTNNLLTISNQWDDEKNLKKHTSVKGDEEFKSMFLGGCYCYFPSDRYEYPYWLGNDIKDFDEQLSDPKTFSNSLNKPIIIRKSLQEVKNWILDVFLDQNFEVNVALDDSKTKMTKIKLFDVTIKNIEHIISQIVGQPVSLGINLRVHNSSRLKLIDEHNLDYLPSLDNLSAGQSTLLSIFINIVMQSENINIMNSITLEQITGIVLIDEIDLHLHINLQKNVLPELIKLFPKVQFIVTSHSPFFVNGIDKHFDNNDYQVVNMPTGNQIKYDEFEEFNKAYEVFDTLTNDYKNEIEALKKQITESIKPLVITEGKTDWKHLKKALERFQSEGKYTTLDIDFLEYQEEMGDTLLDKMFDSYSRIPQERKTIFLFDRDNNSLKKHKLKEFNKSNENVYSLCIPHVSEELDLISLEFYYEIADLKTLDKNGRRLFLGEEFNCKTGISSCKQYVAQEKNKVKPLSIIDNYVYQIEDEYYDNSIALSKNTFAEYILNDEANFDSFDISKFEKIFDVLEKVVRD